MTDKEKSQFIELAQMGVACGLYHPIEWYINLKRCLTDFLPKEKQEEKQKELKNTMISFYKSTSCADDDNIENLDEDGFDDLVDNYYSIENLKKHKERLEKAIQSRESTK
jgi:hypothetical protein